MALTLPVLALLDEPDYQLQEHALESLDASASTTWPHIVDYISRIEELHENPQFPAKQLAALVAAKVYYYLGDIDSAVNYALAAGSRLDLSTSTEFVDSVITRCTAIYIESRQATDAPDAAPGVEKIVVDMINRCVPQNPKLALGIALECRRTDLIQEILAQSCQENIHFVLETSIALISNRAFRTQVLRLLADIVRRQQKIDHMALVKIVIQLDDDRMAINLFKSIEDEDLLLQIAFDIVASASQELLEKIIKEFAYSHKQIHAKIVKVLSGVPTTGYEATFLRRNKVVDISALERSKNALESRNSMFHSAVSFQNAFLHAGTTCDRFFRANVEWLGRASYWTRFTATAALGVIHRGNLTQGRRILQPYLSGGLGSAPYRGGSLYGLGLVFAGFGKEVLEYLQEIITKAEAEPPTDENDVILHGASLGLGLAAMRTGNAEVYDRLRSVLFHDSAVAGEAAGLAMGLVMLGSRNEEAQNEMFSYAKDTRHEKIQRSLALGIAMLNYAREEQSDGIVDSLLSNQEANLRYGGCFTIALAYAGTANTKATKRLLHTAVSDASDDVRRAAVISLGFILLRNPTAAPRVVKLLSHSYNPHVRYGTTMALGIACAGTALPAAIDILEPMMKDPVDFVRQGAMIALSMILIQHTDQNSTRVKNIRRQFTAVIDARLEDGMAKFGAALAQGIIDAGGCNSTISVERPATGNLNMKAVVGLAVFVQYWYWFPLAHFLSMAFTPTNITCVRSDLKIPELSFTCNAPPKLFDYSVKAAEEDNKTPQNLFTAILSTTLKDKRSKQKDAMEVDEEPGSKEQKHEVSKEQKYDDKFILENMSRVVPWQREHIVFDSKRYQPVISRKNPNGVIVVSDNDPEAPTKFIKTLRQSLTGDDEDEEAPIPAPFFIPTDNS